MAIIYSYPLNFNILDTDIVVGTSTKLVGGKKKNFTKSFSMLDIYGYIASNLDIQAPNLQEVTTTGNITTLDIQVNGLTIGRGNGSISGNTAIGDNALKNSLTGNSNTAGGFYSLFNNTDGNGNSVWGYNASFYNTIGNENVSVGTQSLLFNTTGSNNTAIGSESGKFLANKTSDATILNNSVMLGCLTSPLGDNQSNQIVIGYNATGLGSNTTTIGDTSITTTRLRGAVLGGSFVKDGGTNLQYLMADGSVSAGDSIIPDLQQVTTIGETTNVGIKVIGLEKYISVTSQDNETGAVTISTDVNGLPYIQLGLTANENTAIFRADNINTNSVYQLPNQSGVMALISDIPTQGLTSVGLTMPLAFNVANSPLTSNGALAVTALGTASQYIRGDGQLAAFPSTGGGGSSVNYYLNGSIPSSVVGYQQMDNDAVIGVGTDFSLTGNGLIAQFLTDIGNPNRLEIPGGAWNFEMFFSMSSNGGIPKFYVELLKYNGAVFTSIASSSLVPETINGGTAIDLYLASLAVPTTPLLVTDRLAIRVYIVNNSDGRTATLHTEDSHLCEIITTFSGGVTSLNGLTANTQYLAVGTSGTNFNISSVSETHTFNLPSASVTARGLVTINDQSFSGLKNFTDNIIVNTIRIWRGDNNTATNIGIGLDTLIDNSGNQNTVLGYQAVSSLLSASSFTTAVGYQSLKNVLGNNNTAIGNLSGLLLTGGSQNTFIGSQAGGVVGQLVNAANSVAIGYQAITTKNNQVVLGNSLVTETVLNGLVLAPLTTNTLIDANLSGKSLVTKEYVNNRLVVERTTGYTLTNADSGGIIIFKTAAAQTLNIPLGLADGFECTFVTLAGITLTVPSVVGITLNNAVGTTMAGGLSFTLKRMLTTDTFIVTGNL
jgi:hypothetical protein